MSAPGYLKRWAATAWSRPWAALAGIAVGVLIAPGGGMDWAYALYDKVRPVVRMSGRIVERDAGVVVIAIDGAKLRACEYLAIRAYADVGWRLLDVNATRVDRPEDRHTKPIGVFDLGRWRVWPTDEASAVLMYSTHSCDGRLVVSKLAEVRL